MKAFSSVQKLVARVNRGCLSRLEVRLTLNLSRVGLPAWGTDHACHQQRSSPVPPSVSRVAFSWLHALLGGLSRYLGRCLPGLPGPPTPGSPRSRASHQWTHTHHHLPCPIVGIKPLPTNKLPFPLPPASLCVRRGQHQQQRSTPSPLQVETAFLHCLIFFPRICFSVSFISSSRSALRGHFQAHQARVFPFHLPLTPSNFTSRHQLNFPNSTATCDIHVPSSRIPPIIP